MARKPKAEGATPKPAKKGATPRKATSSTNGATPAADKKTGHETKHNEQYTPAQIIAALGTSAGIVSAAARILRCGRATIYRYIERYPEIQAAIDEIEQDRIDLAEAGLVGFLGDEKHPTLRLKAIEFYLRTKGKNRGYTMATELMGKGGGPIETENKVTIDVSNLSAADLELLEKAAAAAAARG